MIEISLLALGVLVFLLTLGVPLPFCFGGALMVMNLVGGTTMKGMMLTGFTPSTGIILDSRSTCP